MALMSAHELAEELGERVQKWRQASGLAVEDMARQARVSIQAVEAVEAGRKVDVITFMRIASELRLETRILEACEPPSKSLDEIVRQERELGN